MKIEIRMRQFRQLLEEVWWEGHRDVCTDCTCRAQANPYYVPPKEN